MENLTDIDTLLSASPHTLITIGLILVFSLLARGLLMGSVLPPMLIYMMCGLLLGVGNAYYDLLDQISRQGLELLAEVGLVLLLFKVGLESDIKGLRKQLPKAAWIWLWDVLLSASLGFFTA